MADCFILIVRYVTVLSIIVNITGSIKEGPKNSHVAFQVLNMETDPTILAARAKLKAKLGETKPCAKGAPRRAKKPAKKVAGADDKKLQGTLKRLGAQPIPAIDEINMFLADGNVIHFKNPRCT